MIFNSSAIVSFLKDTATKQIVWWPDYVKTSFVTSAEDYLRYAEEDLSSTLPHRSVNALSNAQRALHCQLDRLLKLVSQYKYTTGFPNYKQKVARLAEFGIRVPKALAELNAARNLMEHRYMNFKRSVVRHHLHHVRIFIEYTQFYTNQFWGSVVYENAGQKEKYGFTKLCLQVGNGFLFITADGGSELSLKIHKDDESFASILKIHLRLSYQHFLEEQRQAQLERVSDAASLIREAFASFNDNSTSSGFGELFPDDKGQYNPKELTWVNKVIFPALPHWLESSLKFLHVESGLKSIYAFFARSKGSDIIRWFLIYLPANLLIGVVLYYIFGKQSVFNLIYLQFAAILFILVWALIHSINLRLVLLDRLQSLQTNPAMIAKFKISMIGLLLK